MLKTKIKQHLSLHRTLALVGLGALVFLSQAHPLIAQAVTQGYNTDDSLQRGMIVMLKKGDPTKVTMLTNDKADKMQGVVVGANDALITISNGSQKAFVANSGKFAVLVSDQNGSIAVGDYVGISALAGIGMKTDDTSSLILGKAVEKFDGKSGVLSTAKIKDGTGAQKTVHIGLIITDINITKNPTLRSSAQVPDFLRKSSQAVAQKDVAANRIYIGMVVLLLTAVIAGIVLYAGVRSSMIALGRNPLSKKTILRSLFQVVLTSVIIFLCGLFGVYLLLKL